MINNIQYTNIRVILDELTQHELLQDLTLEQVVGYTIKFNGLFNITQLYKEKQAITEVKDTKDNVSLRYISGTFFRPNSYERAFKTQGNFIFTTFKEGKLEIAYNAVPVDEEGYPMILDNEKYKNALCLFIKVDRFTKYFDTGKISQAVLQNTQQEYAWAAGQLSNELKMPSYSEMENISNAHNQLLQKTHEFEKSFETLGLSEHYKKH